jgi:hypothetical protein
VIDRARAWAGLLVENFGIPGVAIGIYSILDSGKNKRFNLIVTWIFVVYGLFALFYASYDSYVYLIQTLLAFSLWLGFGINCFIEYMMDRWRNAGWILFPLFILFFILRINSAVPKVNASNDDRAELFGQLVFDTVPENAMIFTKDDQTTFALWYFHFAVEERLDTNIIAEGLLGFDWYRQSLRTTYSTLKVPEIPDLAPYNLINQNPDHPFCFVDYKESTNIKCSRYLNN